MKIMFYKYQGTGNDFIIIDNRHYIFDKNDTKKINRLCDRRFGIGADGLILLENHPEYDFKMVYFNSDGNESSMCGNGGRCITAFARHLGIINADSIFEAIDGLHRAEIVNNQVRLQMKDVEKVEKLEDHVFIDTGSPHVVTLVEDVKEINVKSLGRDIRYSERYSEQGVNVNFIEPTSSNKFIVRTYERGVEDETLSCGTGVTAAAIYAYSTNLTNEHKVEILTPGGNLNVTFDYDNGKYTNIWLEGPAEMVFKGEIE